MGLRPRFKTPFSQARDKLVAYAIRPLRVFQPRTRFLIGCSVLVLLTTLLLLSNRSSFEESYKHGDVLGRAIVAPADLTAVDPVETERRKATARETTRAIFNFDSSRAETSVQSFRSAWEDLKKQFTGRNFNEADLDRLASIIRETGSGYIYDDDDTDRLQNEIVLVDVRD